MLVTVGVPKLLIGLALSYVGGIYVMGSADREALILNTMALNFVIEVPQLLYKAFTSQYTQECVQNMEPIMVSMNEKDALMMWVASTVIYPMLVFIFACFIVTHYKTVVCGSFIMPWRDDSGFMWPWQMDPNAETAGFPWPWQFDIHAIE